LKNVVTVKLGQRSLNIIGTDTDRSATYDFLLTFHSNHEPASHRFRDRRRFHAKIATTKNSNPCILHPRLPFELGIGPGNSRQTGMMGLSGGPKR